MAGKRQHYVPRFLQRGFLADPTDEGERTWLHRRGASPKLVGIGDIGVEDWFYSRKSVDGTLTLDDAITEYERDLSKRVNELRETAPGAIVPSRYAAETVIHLVLRAAHLRNLMSGGIRQFTCEIEALFADPVRLRGMIGLTGPTLGEAISKAIQEAAAELTPAGIPTAFCERQFTFVLRECGDQFVMKSVTMLAPLVRKLVGDIAAQVRESHNAVLGLPVADTGWVTELAKFKWTTESAEDLILPDAVALSRAAGKALAPLLFTSGVEVELVVMPIASGRSLVGRRGDAVFDFTRFNQDAAAASESFFIAARPMGDVGLIERIGAGPAETLKRVIIDVVREAEHARQVLICDIPPAQPEERVVQDFSYTVRLVDFGDAVRAKEIADVVQAVVAGLARDLPLQDLDGLTIAADYDAALINLDRGDPALPRVTSGALGYGRGVAMPVMVQREGVRKEHLVFAAGIAETWLSPDLNTRASGLHTLITMLAGIAHAARYASARGVGLPADPMLRELHVAVATTPAGYWAARLAAFVAPNEGATYADCVVESLGYAEREVATLRAQMKDSCDIGPTTTRALECVAAILNHAAHWLGHRDGLAEGEAFAGSDLPERLRASGLDHWITVFGRDLSACYGPEGALEFSAVITLSRHVERLFWCLGVYCWPEGDDVRCVVTNQSFIPPRELIREGLC